MTGVLFFSAAAIVILVATILTEIMLRSPFYVFYLKKAEEGRNVQLVRGPPPMTCHLTLAQSETESYPSSEDALLLGPGSNAEPTLKSVFKKIWPDAMSYDPFPPPIPHPRSVFLVFIVTLSLFPGFTVMIPNFDPALGDKQLPNSTLPLVLVVRLARLSDRVHHCRPSSKSATSLVASSRSFLSSSRNGSFSFLLSFD